MSASRFTLSPALSFDKVVTAQVCGMISTPKPCVIDLVHRQRHAVDRDRALRRDQLRDLIRRLDHEAASPRRPALTDSTSPTPSTWPMHHDARPIRRRREASARDSPVALSQRPERRQRQALGGDLHDVAHAARLAARSRTTVRQQPSCEMLTRRSRRPRDRTSLSIVRRASTPAARSTAFTSPNARDNTSEHEALLRARS